MVKNKEDAEELTQDIFIKIYKGLSNFREKSQLKTWIYRITVNTCITKLKSRKYKEYKNKRTDIRNVKYNSVNNIEESLMVDEINSKIELALDLLSNEYRQIIIMLYFEELSYKEIGEILEIPIGTVCTKVFRARNKIKEILRKELAYEM